MGDQATNYNLGSNSTVNRARATLGSLSEDKGQQNSW